MIAAWIGLEPAPESRFRRAYLHLLENLYSNFHFFELLLSFYGTPQLLVKPSFKYESKYVFKDFLLKDI